jgi:hypothetical protein
MVFLPFSYYILRGACKTCVYEARVLYIYIYVNGITNDLL